MPSAVAGLKNRCVPVLGELLRPSVMGFNPLFADSCYPPPHNINTLTKPEWGREEPYQSTPNMKQHSASFKDFFYWIDMVLNKNKLL